MKDFWIGFHHFLEGHGIINRDDLGGAVLMALSELCGIECQDVDLENYKIRINQGKGSKDRFVLFGKWGDGREVSGGHEL